MVAAQNLAVENKLILSLPPMLNAITSQYINITPLEHYIWCLCLNNTLRYSMSNLNFLMRLKTGCRFQVFHVMTCFPQSLLYTTNLGDKLPSFWFSLAKITISSLNTLPSWDKIFSQKHKCLLCVANPTKCLWDCKERGKNVGTYTSVAQQDQQDRETAPTF